MHMNAISRLRWVEETARSDGSNSSREVVDVVNLNRDAVLTVGKV